MDRASIQAKRYGLGNSVGPGAIRDFLGNLNRHTRPPKGLFVTTSASPRALAKGPWPPAFRRRCSNDPLPPTPADHEPRITTGFPQ
ncbi:restriction endonuclease [Nitrobacter sp. NHB1]|uniref:restriction endonuclease n=1 Tax=Nitrobacter sp. NHB1 TaxID=3119830 RepID=UPI003000B4AD